MALPNDFDVRKFGTGCQCGMHTLKFIEYLTQGISLESLLWLGYVLQWARPFD